MKKIVTFRLLTLVGLFFLNSTYCQVGIGTSTPSSSSMLDISSTNSGLLIPRIALTSALDVTTIPAPTISLLVYNNGFAPNGYYYWSGSLWIQLKSGSNEWNLTGNGGTTAGTNFIGTTDGIDLRIKTGNTDRWNISNANAGQLQAYSRGTATAPIFSFQADQNTGMYSSANNVVDFATQGNNRFSITNNQVLGATRGSENAPFYSFSQDIGLNTGIFSSGENILDFATFGVNRLRIDNSYQLFAMDRGNAGSPFYSFDADQNTGIYSAGADIFNISTGGNERIRVEADGDVGIGATPNASARLEINANNKGLLIPNVALTSRNAAGPIAAPAISLLVYNTATAGIAPNNVVPGYYYWSGTAWIQFATGSISNDWALTGNAGTTTANYLGTSDSNPLKLSTNGTERMRILPNGQIAVNNVGAIPANQRFSVYNTSAVESVINGYSTSSGKGIYGENTGSGLGVHGVNTATGSGVYGSTTGATGAGVFGVANVALGAGTYGTSNGNDGIGVFGNASGNLGNGVFGQSSGTNGTGVFGYANAAGGDGVYGEATQANRFGVWGVNNNASGNGVFGSSTGANGNGVLGTNDNNTGVGVYGTSAGASGIGVVGTSSGANGYGLYGVNNNNTGNSVVGSSTGANATGIYGVTTGANGTAVYGISNGINGDGVVGQASGTTGFGVIGINTNASGTGIISSGNNSGLVYLPSGSGSAFNGTDYGTATWASNTATGIGIAAAGNNQTITTLAGGAGGAFTGNQWAMTGVSTLTGFANDGTDRAVLAGTYTSGGTTTDNVYLGARIGGVNYKILGTGGGSVSTTMNTSQGERILFAPESPENWFFDIGEVQLNNGKAEVKLDPIFVETISDVKPFKVFVQGGENTLGSIRITRNIADKSFIVEDLGGNSDGTVQYTIYAIWKGKENIRLPELKPENKPLKIEIDKHIYKETKKEVFIDEKIEALEKNRTLNINSSKHISNKNPLKEND